MRRVLIGGRWVEPRSPIVREIANPATQVVLDSVADCGDEDVANAVRAAGRAQTGLRRLDVVDRCALGAPLVEALRDRAAPLARVLGLESGKPMCEARDEIRAAIDCLESRVVRPVDSAPPGNESRDGVLAVLTAFDRPLLGLAAAVTSALRDGDALVCKAPQENPLSTLLFAECLEVLPPGLVNVLSGGPATAAALVRAGEVGRVVCSGPRSVRELIAALVAAQGKPAAIDAGAIMPIIVLGGADLDLAAAGAAWAGLRHGGQNCDARVRIYVERGIAAAFADRLHLYTAFLEVGDPTKPDTDLGPLISHEAARAAEEQVARALKDGARLKLGGRSFNPWGLSGHFFQPTILTEVTPGSFGAREEILAPVLTILPFTQPEDLVRLLGAQSTRGAQLYAREEVATRDLLAALRVSVSGGIEHVLTPQPMWFPYKAREGRESGGPGLGLAQH